jgi:hypothetical protein
MEAATLAVAVVTLVVTAATFILVGYDVYRRYRPILRVSLMKIGSGGPSDQELVIDNVGAPTTLNQICVRTYRQQGALAERVIWSGQTLLETYKQFKTPFSITLDKGSQPLSYIIEVKHSGYVVEHRIST